MSKTVKSIIRQELVRTLRENREPWLETEQRFKECSECEGTGKVDAGLLSTSYRGPFYDVNGNVIHAPADEHGIIQVPDLNDESNPVYGDCPQCGGTGQVEMTQDDLDNERDSAMEDRWDMMNDD